VIYIERTNFTLQINTLVDNIVNDFKNNLPDNLDKGQINSLLTQLEQKVTYDDSEYYDRLNLIKNAFIFSCYGIIAISIGLVYFFNKTTGVNTILGALFNVVVILLLEFIFVNIVSVNYISLDVVKTKKMVYDNIMYMLGVGGCVISGSCDSLFDISTEKDVKIPPDPSLCCSGQCVKDKDGDNMCVPKWD
jgi:hypothetical protein